MLLKEALEIHKKSKGKIDILETLGIEIKNNYFECDFYKNKLKDLPNGNYFLSDLDGTFFRGTLIKEAFGIFVKYLKDLNIREIDLETYKNFLDDFKLFKKLESNAYNKKIDYEEYLNAGLFIINKYHHLGNWDKFLLYLKDYFYRKEKVNPFRFSMKKLKEITSSGNKFLFVSGASSFVFEIYLELLKDYIKKELGEKYSKNIFGFCSYSNPKEKLVYNLWNYDGKNNFIKELKKQNIIQKIIGGMGDTSSDYGISNHLDNNTNFYFINPAYGVINNFKDKKNKNIKFNFIYERKDLIFEYDINKIKIFN